MKNTREKELKKWKKDFDEYKIKFEKDLLKVFNDSYIYNITIFNVQNREFCVSDKPTPNKDKYNIRFEYSPFTNETKIKTKDFKTLEKTKSPGFSEYFVLEAEIESQHELLKNISKLYAKRTNFVHKMVKRATKIEEKYDNNLTKMKP